MQVSASHILVRTKEEADNLLTQINEGADFGILAAQHSLCPSKARGGAIGSFGPGVKVKPFQDAAFALEVGAVSATPVQTLFGWHLIQRTA